MTLAWSLAGGRNSINPLLTCRNGGGGAERFCLQVGRSSWWGGEAKSKEIGFKRAAGAESR